jgi:hypothetical protein
MKHFFLLVVLWFTGTHTFAQIDITWGVPVKAEKRTQLLDLVGADKEAVYATRVRIAGMRVSEYRIEKYRKSDMNLVYSKPIPAQVGDSKITITNFFFVKNTLMVFGTYYDREKRSTTCYAQLIGADGNVAKPWTPVDVLQDTKSRNRGSFYHYVNDDSSGVLVVTNPPYDKYSSEAFKLTLIDHDLKTKWVRDMKLPYKDKDFSLKKFIITKKDEVYVLAYVQMDKENISKEDRKKKPTYFHDVLVYDAVYDSLKEYHLTLTPKYITEVTITLDNAGNILSGGFYSNKNSRDMAGTFFMKIDRKTKQVVSSSYKEFTPDFLLNFMSEKSVKKQRELSDYELRYLVLRDDGGLIMVAEEFFVETVCTTDPRTGATSCTDYYHYDDIIMVSIDPNGEIAWTTHIPKDQTSRNDGGYFLSFALAVSGPNIYIMFNDNPKNLDPNNTKLRSMTQPMKSVAVLVTVSKDGDFNKQAMFKTSDLKIILRPKLYLQENEKQLYLFGQKGTTYKLADVNIGT